MTTAPFKVGDKVRLLPHSDLWMRGVGNAPGVVEIIGRKYIHVRFIGWPRPFRFRMDTTSLEKK